MDKNKHGGTRKGAGRPKGEPNDVISITLKKALKTSLIAKYGSKEVTKLIKAYLETL